MSPPSPSPVPDGPPEAPSARQRWSSLALVCGCALLAYANVLANGFVWDDVVLIQTNPWLEGPEHLGDIFGSHFWAFHDEGGVSQNYYRPLVHLTFMLCHALFGFQPWGYHLVSLLGHVAVSGLVYQVGLLLCARRRTGPFAALAAGLLFAVHPIHSEAVAWAAAVNDVTMTLGVVLASWWMMTSGPGLTLRSALAGLAFLFALLFKEPGILLLGMVGVYDVALGDRAWSARQWVGRYAPLAVALAVYAALRLPALAGLGRTLHHTQLGTGGLILNTLPLLAQYVGALVLPLEFNAYHLFVPAESLGDPRVLSGLAALVGLGVVALVLWRREPTAFVALAWCLGCLLPLLYIPALGKNAFAERYLYLPSVGFVLFVGWGLEALLQHRPASRPWLVGALAVVVLGGGVASALRNRVWHDGYALWSDTESKSPEEPSVQSALGLALIDRGQFSEAIPHLERGRQGNAVVRKNLGLAYARMGRLPEAETELQEAVRMKPEDASAWVNLCLVHKNLKQWPNAHEECATAVRLEPQAPEPRVSLAQVLLLMGRLDEAEQHLREALALRPGFAPARRLLERLERERQRAVPPAP
ncbi:tetratricopeptide repeat protein [Cystobacter fuscus]|uniref:tetratricopeptide repeat protein n=1 Tax=Cystobacter fuscus TaxID=43 RepID=UPI002B2A5B1E|nr:tetratricopeptide repeat protein [Cystobacter fuscus]